ncbi:hypothetical protein BDV12DRAFT_203090 [Aspergillus spectabilis]
MDSTVDRIDSDNPAPALFPENASSSRGQNMEPSLPVVDCVGIFSSSHTRVAHTQANDWHGHDSESEYVPTHTKRKEAATNIRRHLELSTYIYAINHGIPEDIQKNAEMVMHNFFQLPLEGKRQVHESRSSAKRGYQCLRQVHDDTPGRRDLREAFKVRIDPTTDPSRRPHAQDPNANQWPDCHDFREALHDYTAGMLRFSEHFIRAISLSLTSSEDFFDQHYTTLNGLSLLYYLPGKYDAEVGRSAHTDFSWFTIINQLSPVLCLQVRTSAGEFETVPYIPNTLVIVAGDFLQRASNGIFSATVHRVHNNTEQERYSVVYFFDADPEAIIDTPCECIREKGSRLYEPVRGGDWKKQLYLL